MCFILKIIYLLRNTLKWAQFSTAVAKAAKAKVNQK